MRLDCLDTQIFYSFLLIVSICYYDNVIRGFRNSVQVFKLHSSCHDIQIFRAKQAVVVAVFKAKSVLKNNKLF